MAGKGGNRKSKGRTSGEAGCGGRVVAFVTTRTVCAGDTDIVMYVVTYWAFAVVMKSSCILFHWFASLRTLSGCLPARSMTSLRSLARL